MNKKISELSSAGSLTGAEVLPIVQSSTTVKTSVQNIVDIVFPYTGSARITGSLGVTGSITALGSVGITGTYGTTGQIGTAIVYPNDPVEVNISAEPVPSFVVQDGSFQDTHKILPNRLVYNGEESNKTVVTYEYGETMVTRNLIIPAQDGTLAVYQTTKGFVLPTTIPSNPLTGSIYFDSGSAQLKVWNGSWVSIS